MPRDPAVLSALPRMPRAGRGTHGHCRPWGVKISSSAHPAVVTSSSLCVTTVGEGRRGPARAHQVIARHQHRTAQPAQSPPRPPAAGMSTGPNEKTDSRRDWPRVTRRSRSAPRCAALSPPDSWHQSVPGLGGRRGGAAGGREEVSESKFYGRFLKENYRCRSPIPSE